MSLAFYVGICAAVGHWNRLRGNSFAVGFVLSFVTFIVPAVIFIALTKKNDAKLLERSIAAGALKRCPACAETIKAEALKCKHCGSAVDGTVHIRPLGKL
jgi:hypothetical protein